MRNIRYLVGDASRPYAVGNKIIVHSVNDIGKWGKGFVTSISDRWKLPEREYKKWHKVNPTDDSLVYTLTGEFALGSVQFIQVEKDTWVANLIAQRGIMSDRNPMPIRYEALGRGLQSVAKFADRKDASVHMPKIGAGLGGGDWNIIESIIEATVPGATVYQLES